MCEEGYEEEDEEEVYGPGRWDSRNGFMTNEEVYSVPMLEIDDHIWFILNKLDCIFKYQYPEFRNDNRQSNDYKRIFKLECLPYQITFMRRLLGFLERKKDDSEKKTESDFRTSEKTRDFYCVLQSLIAAEEELCYQNEVEKAWEEIAKAQHCCGMIVSRVLNDYRNADLPERLLRDVEKPIKQKQNRNSHISREENNKRICNLVHNLVRERNKKDDIDETARWVHEQLSPPKETLQSWLSKMPDREQYFKSFETTETTETTEESSSSYSKLVKEEAYFLIRQNYKKSKCLLIEEAASGLLDKSKRFASTFQKNIKRLKQPAIPTLKKYILRMEDKDKYINVVNKRNRKSSTK